jgi:hypothetical protein
LRRLLARALAGGTLGLGAALLALSFGLYGGSLSPSVASRPPVEAPPDYHASIDPPVAQRVSVETPGTVAEVASGRPADQAPVEPPALPAQEAPADRSAPAAPEGPFSIVVTLAGEMVAPVANGLVERLTRWGFDVRVSGLDAAGRPDAIVVLGARPGPTAEAWFCDPGPESGAMLAGLLRSAAEDLGPGTTPPVGGTVTPLNPFSCGAIQSGRAGVAAALIELPFGVFEAPDAADRARALLSAAVERYFASNEAAVLRARKPQRLIWPATGPITSRFGPAHPLGIDIGQSAGNIVAATEGTVVFAGGDPCCSYGRYVVVDSPDGLRTLYAHLASIAVSAKQTVRQGQVLGRVGCSGTCAGVHLHFEVWVDGVRRDALRYLP